MVLQGTILMFCVLPHDRTLVQYRIVVFARILAGLKPARLMSANVAIP